MALTNALELHGCFPCGQGRGRNIGV